MSTEDQRRVQTIAGLTNQLKWCLRTNFSNIWVSGEITDLMRPSSGHVYMTLKDKSAQLKAIVWRSNAERLKVALEDGMEVICRGEIDIYSPRGNYQLIVQQVELQGEGALQRKLRKLKERLEQEGLFNPMRKKPLPAFPQRVAVVTSPTGAAIRDFLEVARRRWNGIEIVILPVRVQGDLAAAEISGAIQWANRMNMDFDVMVVTRGGGSIEDLWSFNEEAVVRAIYESEIPVVSGVGHEIDVTLADLAADVRTVTPSEAAERVLPSMVDVRSALNQWAGRMSGVMRSRMNQAKSRLDGLAARRVLTHPQERVQVLGRRLDELDARARRATKNRIQQARMRMSQFATQLESLSPLGVLGRGYSITQSDDGKVIRRVEAAKSGDVLRTRVVDGELISRVENVVPLETDES
ncbi:MAG: exodeoxyribonuclease VII large subunit [Planctomycetota bacterium]